MYRIIAINTLAKMTAGRANGDWTFLIWSIVYHSGYHRSCSALRASDAEHGLTERATFSPVNMTNRTLVPTELLDAIIAITCANYLDPLVFDTLTIPIIHVVKGTISEV